MAQILYNVLKAQNCGCYQIQTGDGVIFDGPLVYDSNCDLVDCCTCNVSADDITIIFTPPTQVTECTVGGGGFLIPNAPLVANQIDGSISLSIDVINNDPINLDCDFGGSYIVEDNYVALFRGHSIPGCSVDSTCKIVNCGTAWNTNCYAAPACEIDSRVDSTESDAVDVLITTSGTPFITDILITGVIATTVDNYSAKMEYFLQLQAKDSCAGNTIHLEYDIPHNWMFDGAGAAICAADVITVTFTLTHDSLVDIQAGTIFDLAWTCVEPITSYTIAAGPATIDIGGTTLTLSSDWSPNTDIEIEVTIDDVGCLLSGLAVTLDAESTTVEMVNNIITQTITLL